MSKSITNTTKKVPKLRFREFSGEWEEKKLGKIFKVSAGGDISGTNVSQIKNEKFKYPIYANAEKNKGLYGYADIYKIDENVLTVAGRGVNIGITHARNHKFYPIVRLLVLKPINNEDIYFFEYQINRLNLFKESTGVPQLTAPQVSGYDIYYPQVPEQQKIASFLTSVDNKITKLTEKKKLLETYKKGAMQKIFSKEIRFKNENGEEFAEWERKKLGEICDIKKGEQLNGDTFLHDGIYPVLNGGINLSGFTDKYNRMENTITISEGGNSCGYVNIMKNKFWCGGHCYSIEEIKSNGGFLYHILKFSEKVIMRLRVGSGLPNIQKGNLLNLKLSLPKSLIEQQKIASFLTEIDTKIEVIGKELKQFEDWKKGLLQEMFV